MRSRNAETCDAAAYCETQRRRHPPQVSIGLQSLSEWVSSRTPSGPVVVVVGLLHSMATTTTYWRMKQRRRASASDGPSWRRWASEIRWRGACVLSGSLEEGKRMEKVSKLLFWVRIVNLLFDQ